MKAETVDMLEVLNSLNLDMMNETDRNNLKQLSEQYHLYMKALNDHKLKLSQQDQTNT